MEPLKIEPASKPTATNKSNRFATVLVDNFKETLCAVESRSTLYAALDDGNCWIIFSRTAHCLLDGALDPNLRIALRAQIIWRQEKWDEPRCVSQKRRVQHHLGGLRGPRFAMQMFSYCHHEFFKLHYRLTFRM